MALPFNWPGKKDGPEPAASATSSKLEFPEGLDMPSPPPARSKADPPPTAGKKDDAALLQELTNRYGQIRSLLEQANEQVLAYLMERHSQTATQATPGDGLGKKLDACMAKIEMMAVGSGVTLGEKLDALAGKLEKLSSGGGAAAGCFCRCERGRPAGLARPRSSRPCSRCRKNSITWTPSSRP